VTTILAPTPNQDSASILRRAADLIDALPYYRVNRTDVHRALYKAAGSYRAAQDALTALHRATRDDGWLLRWSTHAPRQDAAEQLRAAAERATEVAR
jgi:hypothetical protein